MAYNKTVWTNDTAPAINADNLNKIEQGIYDAIEQISDVNGELLDSMEYVESYNLINPDNIENGYFYNLAGTRQESSSYACTDKIIPVNQGDVLRFYSSGVASNMRYVTAYNAEGSAVSASGAENTNTYTVPNGIKGVRISYQSNFVNMMLTKNNSITIYEPYFAPYYIATQQFIDKYGVGKSGNLLNAATITENTYIRLNGTSGSSTSYDVTDYIPVNPGDVIIVTFQENLVLNCRYITAYSKDKIAVPSSGVEYASSYTVPAGIYYIRISGDKRYLPDVACRVNYKGVSEKFVPYYRNTVNALAEKNYDDISALKLYSVSTLPEYILKNLKYKPLGELSKGYICLVSDDGLAEIATYTIPMVISKEVPCTFAVMKSSLVWNDSTNKAIVIDAVQNHGCEIAQHGGRRWTEYDEYTLNKFFDDEKEFFDTLGLTPYGAVCPAHLINDMIRVVAGGRFGCLRTGYDDGTPYYLYNNNYINGPRSNMNGLTSQSSLDGDLDQHKDALDAVKENHWLRVIHWHENELTAEMKTQLEGIIDYAKHIGLTFITMKDIPTIV